MIPRCLIHLPAFVCLACAIRLSQQVPAPPGDAPDSAQVRSANRPIWDEAEGMITRIREGTGQLAARAASDDDLRGKTESVRKEIVQLYRLLSNLERIGDELLLRGERDGLVLRHRTTELAESLGKAVAALRPRLGSPQGLSNAMVRRAKEQLGAIRQLEDLIKQREWTKAQAKLDELRAAADEFGRFPDPAEAQQLYQPLLDCQLRIRPGFLATRKPQTIPALREEYKELEPNIAGLRDQLAAAVAPLARKNKPQWHEQPVPGPELLTRVAEAWTELDAAVVRATAIVHAIGPAAETDLRLLRADYESVRIQALNLVRELISFDAQNLDDSMVEPQYRAYVDAIPPYMSALHATPSAMLASTTALNQLAARQPEFEKRVRLYRLATDESLRWRRRLVRRYQQNYRRQNESVRDFDNWVDQSVSATPSADSAEPIKHRVETTWSIDRDVASVAASWRERERDTLLAIPGTWLVPGPGDFVLSPWRHRVMVEGRLENPAWNDLVSGLTRDLLIGSDRPALTIDIAILVHTAARGPFTELGGTVQGVTVENLPDRLWDIQRPGDVAGALAEQSLSEFPAMPALVRIELEPAWLVHELLSWSGMVEPEAEPETPTPGVEPPARQLGQSPPAAAASTPPPTPNPAPATAPSAAPTATQTPPSPPATQPGTAGPAKKPSAPPQNPPPKAPATPPPGGVRF